MILKTGDLYSEKERALAAVTVIASSATITSRASLVLEPSNRAQAKSMWPEIEFIAGRTIKFHAKELTPYNVLIGNMTRTYYLAEPDYSIYFIPWGFQHVGLWQIRRKHDDLIDYRLLIKGLLAISGWLTFRPGLPAHIEIPGMAEEREAMMYVLESAHLPDNLVFFQPN